MKYNRFLGVDRNFQTSVNLEFDLNNIEKVRGYIPTEQSVKILGEYLKAVYFEQEHQSRASVLIGPYGRGKSHLFLILSAILSLDIYGVSEKLSRDMAAILDELCSRIKEVDSEIGALASEIVASNIRLLPIIINSNSSDINQAFLVALKDALDNAGLSNLLPETYFDVATSMIDKWRSSFPDAMKKLTSILNKQKITVEDLYMRLNQYNQDAYRLFCDCYPEVAAGSTFNPLTNMDVVKLYASVNTALCEQTQYSGMYIVFDEFSKFLESNLESAKMYNFKIIQDMAEAATRSGKKQMHFACITHKEILDYSTSDSFKTVEGRFKQIHFVSSSEQSYELIANAIKKHPEYNEFKEKYQHEFKKAIDQFSLTGLFADLSEESFVQKLVFGCFPLSPLTAYALLRVSEKVGQNERTLFTFLAQDDDHTLTQFINKDHASVSFLTFEYIYDYFEPLFRKEVFNASVHSIWAKADSAIRQLNDKDQINIVKAISIIYIVNDDNFKAMPTSIRAALVMDEEVFTRAVNALLRANIMSQRDSAEYVLLTANGVDVQKNVAAQAAKIAKINRCKILSEAVSLGYIIPREYNDRYSIFRYFKNVFMEASEFLKYKNAQQINVGTCDGIIIHIINDDTQLTESITDKISSFKGCPQIVICVSTVLFDKDILLKKYLAVQDLKKSKTAALDPHYLDELEVFEEDLKKSIDRTISSMFSASSANSAYHNCDGAISGVFKQNNLNQKISQICEKCYSETPIINNEMVNKNVLSGQVEKARDVVVGWILDHSDDNVIPCMSGYGPEVSIFKSFFSWTGLDKSQNVDDKNINSILALITARVRECEHKKRNFDDLYQTLTGTPYGVRQGIIPLFIAYVLRQYKENVIFYYAGKEVELSSELLANLNASPASYTLLLESGTETRDEYLGNLEALFASYIDVNSGSINRVYRVVRGMQGWMRSLPEYTKKYQTIFASGKASPISDAVVFLRSELLKYDINSRELLFTAFANKFGKKGQFDVCYQTICDCKAQLDNHLSDFKLELSKKAIALFAPKYQGGLSSAIKTWFDALSDDTKKQMFDIATHDLMKYASKLDGYDDSKALNDLAYLYTSMAVEDWNDALVEKFLSSLSNSISKVNDFVVIPTSKGLSNMKITLSDRVIETSFSNIDISPLGSTVLRNLKSIFDDYNGSIEPDEQLAILIRMMKDIID